MEKFEHLEAFRRNVWGNSSALTVKSTRHGGRTVEHLDLGDHFEALRLFKLPLKRKILIVQEYRDAMAAFTGDDPFYKNGACITGQSGIGKSFFVIYAAIERLRGGHPVAVQIAWKSPDEAYYVLFRESGTTIHGATDLTLEQCVQEDLWALSDATIFTPVPVVAFMMPSIRVFQASSSLLNRWNWWAKDCMVFRYIMDIWDMQEIEDLAFILEYDGNETERMKTLAIKYGAVPRTVFWTASDRLHQQEHESHVSSISIRVVQDPSAILFPLVADMGPSHVPDSSAMFFIKPLKEDNAVCRSMHTMSIPTEWLLNRLFAALNRDQAVTRATFVNTLSLFPATCSIARRIFEETVYDFVMHAKQITVHWRERESPEILELPPLSRTHATLADLAFRPPSFYWRPRDTDPVVDVVIVINDQVYVIVMTVARDRLHLARGMTPLWESMPPERKALQWRLLIVGPIQELVKETVVHLDVGDLGVPRLSVGCFVPWL